MTKVAVIGTGNELVPPDCVPGSTVIALRKNPAGTVTVK